MRGLREGRRGVIGVPSGCPEPLPHHASGFRSVHHGAVPCHQPNTDDRRRRRWQPKFYQRHNGLPFPSLRKFLGLAAARDVPLCRRYCPVVPVADRNLHQNSLETRFGPRISAPRGCRRILSPMVWTADSRSALAPLGGCPLPRARNTFSDSSNCRRQVHVIGRHDPERSRSGV